MRVALVHDWLTGLRGGEKVLEVLCELYPDATLFTLVHVPHSTSPTIESLPLRTAFTQRLPYVSKYYRWYLPLYPWAIESLDFRKYDLVISSSHCVAKGAIPSPQALHICYCHTPMRYIWDRFTDYFGKGFKSRFLYGPMAHFLRKWDVASAERVHHFIANSQYVARRIHNYYGRESDAVIHPPVNTDFFVPSNVEPDNYYLVVSALAPYKRLDVAIDCFRTRSETLLIVGTGPEEEKLRARAAKTVKFLGRIDDEELRRLYQHAQATLLPGVEDFGIVPLESQACGRPVVALGDGGAVETIKEDQTGVFFREPSPSALSSAIDKISSLRFNKSDLRGWACGFSRERFKSSIKDFIQSKSERVVMKSN